MAIAFDAHTDDDVNGGLNSPQTTTHTCSGSNRYLVVSVFVGHGSVNAMTSPACTYNGVSMNLLLDETASSFNQRRLLTFGLVAPATGSNTVSFSWGGISSVEIGFQINSYTGVDQTSPVNASVSKGQEPPGSSVTQDITTSVANCMLVGGIQFRHGPASVSAGTGQTLRTVTGSDNQASDDELVTTATTYTQSYSYTNNGSGNELNYNLIALAPAAVTDLSLQVNSLVSVSESVTVRVNSFPSVNDNVTVTENIAVRLVSRVAPFDTVTVTDVPTVRLVSNPSVFDTVTVTDVPTIRMVSNRLVFDSVTITESVTIQVTRNLSVIDTVTVTDVPTVRLVSHISVVDNVSTTEYLSIAGGGIIISDSVTVTEAVTVVIPTIFISVFDTLTIDDVPSILRVSMFLDLEAFDTVSVAENYEAEYSTFTTDFPMNRPRGLTGSQSYNGGGSSSVIETSWGGGL